MAAAAQSSAKTSSATNGKGSPATLSRDEELAAYRMMLTIRRFEEKAGQMYGMGLIGGFCHLYIGQEAVVVGMQMVLKSKGGSMHMFSVEKGFYGGHGIVGAQV